MPQPVSGHLPGVVARCFPDCAIKMSLWQIQLLVGGTAVGRQATQANGPGIAGRRQVAKSASGGPVANAGASAGSALADAGVGAGVYAADPWSIAGSCSKRLKQLITPA